MNQRVAIYVRQTGSRLEPVHVLRQTVENRGATVVATFTDDARITGRGKYAGWRNLMRMLDQVDQVALSNAGDIPGNTVADLLQTLCTLRDHGVGLYLHLERIDTSDAGSALLD